jgi:hypothetical protein
MAPQPTGDATLTDKDLDEAVESMFDEGTETPTGAPESTTAEPVPDGTSSDAPHGQRPGRRRNTRACRSRSTRPGHPADGQRARSPGEW